MNILSNPVSEWIPVDALIFAWIKDGETDSV